MKPVDCQTISRAGRSHHFGSEDPMQRGRLNVELRIINLLGNALMPFRWRTERTEIHTLPRSRRPLSHPQSSYFSTIINTKKSDHHFTTNNMSKILDIIWKEMVLENENLTASNVASFLGNVMSFLFDKYIDLWCWFTGWSRETVYLFLFLNMVLHLVQKWVKRDHNGDYMAALRALKRPVRRVYDSVQSPPPQDLAADTKHDIQTNQAGECIICWDNNATCAALPCGHLNYCVACSRKLCNQQGPGDVTCSKCSQPVKEFKRLFF
jgi:Zinc finger, C3HC4 type (RING finger)